VSSIDRKRDLWTRAALLGGFAAAALVLALHTRMTLLYFGRNGLDWAGARPGMGPSFAAEWASHLGRFLAAALFFASLPGLGRLALGFRAPPAGASSLTSVPATASAVGLILWSTAGFLLAALGLSTPALVRLVSLLLLGAGLIADAGLWADLRRRIKTAAFPDGKDAGFLAWAAASVGLFYLLTTIVPETFYDALVYHLAAPQAWLAEGRMVDMPDLHLWRLPGLMQTLYLWALAWSDDRLCKVLTVGIGILSTWSLGRWAARRFGAAAGGWAALLYISSPLVGVNLWSCANDAAAGFFLFLALAHWIDGWERPGNDALALSGLLFGAAVAVKTNALFLAPFFLLDVFFRRARGKDAAAALRRAAVFAVLAALPMIPWWTRNALWTGNPFFPQASFLGGDSPENIALLAGWRTDMTMAGGLFFRALSLARESLLGIEAGRFGFLGPSLLMFLPLAFFLRQDAPPEARAARRNLAAAAIVSYAFFAAVSGRLRYFIPHLPPLFALAGACLADYAGAARRFPGAKPPRVLGAGIRTLAGAAVAMNLLWMFLVFQRFNQGWEVVWGRVAPAEYLRREHIGVYGHPSQGAYDWLKEQKSHGKVFVIGEARTFRSPLPASASGTFNMPGYAQRLKTAPDPERFLGVLKAEGYTHLLINFEEMKRVTPQAYRAEEHLRILGAALDRLAPPVYADQWTALFDIQ
jgi:hypothetical protein